MKTNKSKIILTLILALISSTSFSQNWTLIKDSISPTNQIPLEYDSIYRQPLSNTGWEDGLHISDDGLNLYCTYLPIDFLSFVLNGDLPNSFSTSYLRGAPLFGMDLTTNPIGASEWLHADILYSHRNSISDTFKIWTLSDMKRDFYSEGAPSPVFSNNSSSVEFMLFTSNNNPTNNTDIWFIGNTLANPVGIGGPLPAPINTTNNEDNPNLSRLDNNHLVLFFDSDNIPGGNGDHDIWYSESIDNGNNWSTPTNVNSINTLSKEHQPFLHQDTASGIWNLYYSAYNTDGKLAIFRAEQLVSNDWNSWGAPELVIGAGNSAGIGEPTLTKAGDISFVVIYKDPDSTSIYNHFDSDPWFLQKKSIVTGIKTTNRQSISNTLIFPNPSKESIQIRSKKDPLQVSIYNATNKLVLTTTNKNIDIKNFPKGVYFLKILFESGDVEIAKLLKQ